MFKLFKLPSAEDLAQKQLNDSRRELLVALDAKEYAESIVAYHKARIARLDRGNGK